MKHLIEFALPPKKRANAAEVTSETEHATNPKKQLKKRDDGRQTDTLDVTLSQHTAKAMADSFFKFVEQEHLQQHLSRMSAGRILVLCIFHSRLSWQKGKPLELHDRDHYWIPKPTYFNASGSCRRPLRPWIPGHITASFASQSWSIHCGICL